MRDLHRCFARRPSRARPPSEIHHRGTCRRRGHKEDEMNGDFEEYARRHEAFLTTIASKLEVLVKGHFDGLPNVDRISARAKSPSRFAEKATKTEHGVAKYRRPLVEIQDQIGARIIVFYREDVPRAKEQVDRYFTAIEEREVVPESQWAFGYFGKHYILSVPRDVVPQETPMEQVPRFFELQIK